MTVSYLRTRRCSHSELGWWGSAQMAQGRLDLRTRARLPHDKRKERWSAEIDSGSGLHRSEGHLENGAGRRGGADSGGNLPEERRRRLMVLSDTCMGRRAKGELRPQRKKVATMSSPMRAWMTVALLVSLAMRSCGSRWL
jgi:hypothetical protein